MAVVDDIREQLKQLGLDTRGNKTTLKQRLRKYLKKDGKTSTTKDNHSSDDDNDEEEEGTTSKPQKPSDEKKRQQKQQEQEQDVGQRQKVLHKNSRYDYYLCFDVEATCELGFRFEFPSEVIEFPVVLLDGSTLEIVSRLFFLLLTTRKTFEYLLVLLFNELASLQCPCSFVIYEIGGRIPLLCTTHTQTDPQRLLYRVDRNQPGTVHSSQHSIVWRSVISRRPWNIIIYPSIHLPPS